MNAEIRVIVPPQNEILNPCYRFGPNDRGLLIVDYSCNYSEYIIIFNTIKEKFDEKIVTDVIKRNFVKRLEKYLEV